MKKEFTPEGTEIFRYRVRSAAGGRNDRIANGASRSRAGNEETDSKYAKGIRKK
jgi:hypothetical protein